MLEGVTDWPPAPGPATSGVPLPPPPTFAVPPSGSGGAVWLVVAAGVGAAIGGALLWAGVDYLTGYTTSIVSLVIGLLVGRRAPRPLALMAGALSLAGAVFGQLLAVYALVSRQFHIGVLTVIRELPAHDVWLDYRSSTRGLTLLIFALAGWWGYREALGPMRRAGFGGGWRPR